MRSVFKNSYRSEKNLKIKSLNLSENVDENNDEKNVPKSVYNISPKSKISNTGETMISNRSVHIPQDAINLIMESTKIHENIDDLLELNIGK